MQSILRFLPDHALRAVDHVASDFLPAMGGQAVHEQGIGAGKPHHFRIHLPILEIALALFVLRLEAHAGPHVGGHQVGAARRFHGIVELLVVIGAIEPGALRLDLVAGGGRNVYVEAQYLGGLQPGVADIVRVPDPRHGLAAHRPAPLDEGVDVRKDLAGVVFVGQAVDHRHARVRGETFDDLLLEGTDHHDVAHARDHLCRIFHRFAAAELRIAGAEEDRRSAELVHAGLERQPRARALLLENHHQRAIEKRVVRLVGLELLLDPARAPEQVFELVPPEVLELQKVLRGRHESVRQWATAASALLAVRKVLMRLLTPSISNCTSASFMFRGGSRRTTVSAVTLISRPASRPRSTRSPQGRSSSIPIIRPLPRISLMPATPASLAPMPSRVMLPSLPARVARPSSSMTASVASAATQARGLPPKVEPCLPGVKASATAPLARHAPIGNPFASPLASVTTSGLMPAC